MVTETSRLWFREFTLDDAALLYTLNSDPDVLRYLHEEPPADLAAAAEKINSNILPQYRQYGYGRWAVFTRDGNRFIGWCGLKYRPERAAVDLGYRFLKTAWGKGYATESARATIELGFDRFGLREITAMAHIENTASLRVIGKLGFSFTGFETVENCPVRVYLLRAGNH